MTKQYEAGDKILVRTNTVLPKTPYLTAEKVYIGTVLLYINDELGYGVNITANDGAIEYILTNNCCHLDCGVWEIVEQPEDKSEEPQDIKTRTK